MFTQEKKTKPNANKKQEQNNNAAVTCIKGAIEAQGAIRIDGTVVGNVITPGKVVIGKTGVLEGDLDCQCADIEGKFDGNLKIAETLSLRTSAVIDGEAVLGKLAVEPGAVFNANCVMRSTVKIVSNGQGKKEQQEKSA